MKRIRIEPITNGTFQISATNPNPGGECLCSPYGTGVDCKGPYMVFQRAHVVTSGRRIIPVICMGSVKAALMHVESGGEVGIVGSGRPEDAGFDGGTPTDLPDYTRLRTAYQQLATTVPLTELPSWDQYLEEKGYEPGGSPTASATRSTSLTGIDPDAKPLA